MTPGRRVRRRVSAWAASRARRATEIEAPIARVFEVAADVEGSPRWQPSIKSADCAERDPEGRQLIVDTVSDGKVRDLKSRLRFSYAEPTSIQWEQEDGDLSAVEGSWTLEEIGEGRRGRPTGSRSTSGGCLGC